MSPKLFILALLAAHFIGDWILQPREMALNKSKDFRVLCDHLCIVTVCLSWASLIFFWGNLGIPFLLLLFVNAVLHGVIDWNIWRIYAKVRGNNVYEHEIGKWTHESHINHDYWFYSTIAIDQFLHLSIIFLLFL